MSGRTPYILNEGPGDTAYAGSWHVPVLLLEAGVRRMSPSPIEPLIRQHGPLSVELQVIELELLRLPSTGAQD